MRRLRLSVGIIVTLPLVAIFSVLSAAPVDLAIPAQPAAEALLVFSQQARIEVLYSFDELNRARSQPVVGRYEPEEALALLLKDTGFAARRNSRGKFYATPIARSSGAVAGRVLLANGHPAGSVQITLRGTAHTTLTDANGEFRFPAVAPGIYRLQAAAPGSRPLEIAGIKVDANHLLRLEPQVLQAADGPTQLEPYVVEGKSARREPLNRAELAPRMAVGNLDLPRTENDALPFKIYDRERISRSGVVDLNQFLQRELLDSDASTRPPEQNGSQSSFLAGSTNLNLRGFGSDATIILVNGRRLPESAATVMGMLGAPDVNYIPLSLVEKVEVLPVSASSLYTGNPVGGVINIILRPDVDATEVTTTYTNALGGYDAPQSSLSLQHGQSLRNDRLRIRFNATFSQALPPTEAELGYRRSNLRPPVSLQESLHRATPNLRSSDLSPLFGPGSPAVTSVAPGADGLGGLAAFTDRAGVRNLALFDSSGGLAASPESLDQPYGRRQERAAYFASVVYDLFPWLQVGLDGAYTQTTVNRGYDVFAGDLTLAANSPYNPFGQAVIVSLNETAPLLGENYSEAHLELYSVVGTLLFKLPAAWHVAFDAQATRNLARYRGLSGVDETRWQELVDTGRYNPLRDTQVYGPPPDFYDYALEYFGEKDRFVTLGDYATLDAAARVTNQSLPSPTGTASVALGTDYRITQLQDYTDESRYADGTLTAPPLHWEGRTLERVSLFGELQAPLVPAAWLPHWVRGIETNLALRYVTSSIAREANLAPTYGLKIDFAGGLSARGSFTTANRYPTSAMSRPVLTGGGGGPGVNYAFIYDPARNENYNTETEEDRDPNLATESAVTQTAGLIFQRGETHRLRLALDFVDTRKTNELIFLDPQMVINLDAIFSGRITRSAALPGDPYPVGRISSLLTGLVNSSWRHSQNWNASLDYAWNDCAGGTLELYGRMVYFQRYDRQVLANSAVVDELRTPSGSASGLMRYRANFGAGWANRRIGFGLDGHYYHSRILPALEWSSQGARDIAALWQYDAYLQAELQRWLPWLESRFGLRAQLRVNNLFDAAFPRYANDPSGAGVQPYGDWRRRTYSLSVTATF